MRCSSLSLHHSTVCVCCWPLQHSMACVCCWPLQQSTVCVCCWPSRTVQWGQENECSPRTVLFLTVCMDVGHTLFNILCSPQAKLPPTVQEC